MSTGRAARDGAGGWWDMGATSVGVPISVRTWEVGGPGAADGMDGWRAYGRMKTMHN